MAQWLIPIQTKKKNIQDMNLLEILTESFLGKKKKWNYLETYITACFNAISTICNICIIRITFKISSFL